jgi:hypothetical protein
MYKATRTFITKRQPLTKYVVEMVQVKQLGIRPKNQCFQNSTDDELLASGYKAVSGWIVLPYDASSDSTEIIAHWWNINPNNQFVDLTSGIASSVQYVVDTEIAEVGQQRYESLTDLVAQSLLLKGGEFFSVNKGDGGLVYQPIKHLDALSLLRLD